VSSHPHQLLAMPMLFFRLPIRCCMHGANIPTWQLMFVIDKKQAKAGAV
jgi:hypothetical protein